jgi:predicted esterase
VTLFELLAERFRELPGPGPGLEAGGAPASGASGQTALAGAGNGGALGGPGGRAGAGGDAAGGTSGGKAGSGGLGGSGGRSISFGTLLDAGAVVSSAAALAESLANPSAASWRKKGDQHRTYHFDDAKADEPFRLYVPTTWDGTSSLPLAMFLHGSGADENTYVDQSGAQMIDLAEEHGYILVSPLGDRGAYGNFLRLSAPFGDEAGAAELMAQVTTDSERTNELSERDVINVLELVLHEYPVDPAARFLFGHSMGSGGTWYIGGKYASYWQGIAPMSGPFVQENGYPWEDVRRLSIFVTEGTQTPSVDASKLLADWLKKNGFKSEYEEVNADHGGMVSLVMPDVFDFFDRARQ